MINRLPPIAIDVKTVEQTAGQIVIDALVESGLNPRTAHNTPMVRSLVGMWGKNEIDRAKFVELCKKVAMFNRV